MLHESRYSHSMHQVIDKFYAVINDEDGSKCHMFVNIPDHIAKNEDLFRKSLMYIFRKECGHEPAGATTKLIITIGDLKGDRANYINERYPEKERLIQCEGGDIEHLEMSLKPWGNS